MDLNRIYTMSFYQVYDLYIKKAERKLRTKDEVDQIIIWLTGYSHKDITSNLDKNITFKEFFDQAPKLNPQRDLITGVVCGVRVEDIEDFTYKHVRYLDKLIDELAKGKKIEKILRS